MSDQQNCTSDGYGNQGCIGTAVSTGPHGPGDLPITGMETAGIGAVGAGAILLGVVIALAARRAGRHEQEHRARIHPPR